MASGMLELNEPLPHPNGKERLRLCRLASQSGISVYIFQVKFPSIALYETFALDSGGKIAGLTLSRRIRKPRKEGAPQSQRCRYVERIF